MSMITRRTFLATSALLPAARAFGAPASAPTVPDTVKSLTGPYPSFGSITRLEPAFDKLIAADAKLEKLAEGFDWSEGPVWVKKGGYLLFSDIPPNTIYKWQEGKGISLFMKPAGYQGTRTDLKEPGTNGLAINKQGELVMCQHGNRRIAKLASLARPAGKQIALAEKYEGKRFNSPNDLVFHSSGDLFFTDPPYGLAKQTEDKEKELPYQGVFRLDTKGKVHLIHDKLERPNGIGLSPDEKTLYVGNSHGPNPVIMAFDLGPDRSAVNPRVLFSATEWRAKNPGIKGEAFDGMKIDKQGNLFATGPGGVLVISPAGRHLGTIMTGEATANCAFGSDGKLYITADMFLARIATATTGIS